MTDTKRSLLYHIVSRSFYPIFYAFEIQNVSLIKKIINHIYKKKIFFVLIIFKMNIKMLKANIYR